MPKVRKAFSLRKIGSYFQENDSLEAGHSMATSLEFVMSRKPKGETARFEATLKAQGYSMSTGGSVTKWYKDPRKG